MGILMRPPLSSHSSTKPRGSKIRACAIDEDLIKPDVGYFFCYFKMVAPTGLKVSP